MQTADSVHARILRSHFKTGRALSLLVTCSLLGGALTAEAASSVALSGRESVNYFYYFGGFAISSDEGEDGAPLPVAGGPFTGTLLSNLEPRTLAIAGNRHAPLHYLFWDGFLDETWSQNQTYDFGDGAQGAVLNAAGASSITQVSQVCGLGKCGLATELHRSTNTQSLEFTLSGASAYDLTGSTRGGQWVDLSRWDENFGQWTSVVFGAIATRDSDFALSGELSAGLYRIGNDPYTFTAGGPDDVDNAWSYTLTLKDASTVPLPAAAWLMGGALGVLTLRRRAS
jgi:hypothetical protein